MRLAENSAELIEDMEELKAELEEGLLDRKKNVKVAEKRSSAPSFRSCSSPFVLAYSPSFRG